MSSSLIILAATYALGFGTLCFLSRKFALFEQVRGLRRYSILSILSPVTIGWLYGWFLRISPGWDSSSYLIAMCFVLLPTSLLEARHAISSPALRNANYLNDMLRPRSLFVGLTAILLIVGLFVVGRAALELPLNANDPLEYFFVARTIFDRQQLTGVYPLIDPEIARGFYGPWTHPPGFVLMIAWAYIAQGTASVANVAKLINVFHMLPFVLMAFSWGGGTTRFRGFMAAYLVLSVPALFSQMLIAHIDLSRLGLWTAAFCLVSVWFASCSWRNSVALGVIVGLAMFVHSIGLLFWAIMLGLLLVVRGPPILSRLSGAVAMLLTAVIFVAPDYWSNLQNFGRLIGDSTPLWEVKELQIDAFLAEERGIATLLEKLDKGIWAQLYDSKLYGYSGAIFLGAVLPYVIALMIASRLHLGRMLRHSTTPNVRSVLLISAIGFLSIIAISAALNMSLIVKNYRYILTMSPIYAIEAPILIDTALRYFRLKRTFVWATSIIGLPWLGTSQRGARLQAALLALATCLLLFPASYRIYGELRRPNIAFPVTTPAPETLEGQNVLICATSGSLRLIGAMNQTIASRDHDPFRILALRPADVAYYAKFPFVSYLDPVLLGSFTAADGSAALAQLKALGVTHLFVPSYRMGEIESSALAKIIHDPGLSTVEQNESGFTLVRLADQPQIFKRDLNAVSDSDLNGIIDIAKHGVFETPVMNGRAGECTNDVVHVEADGAPVLRIQNQLQLRLSSIWPFDPSRKYHISMEIRGVGATQSDISLGIATLDKIGNLEPDPKLVRRPNAAWGPKFRTENKWVDVATEFSVRDQLQKLALPRTGFITLVLNVILGSPRDAVEIRNLRIESIDELAR